MDIKTQFNTDQLVHFIKYDKARIGTVIEIQIKVISPGEVKTNYLIEYIPNSIEMSKKDKFMADASQLYLIKEDLLKNHANHWMVKQFNIN